MTTRRTQITPADLAMWPEFNSSALEPTQREIFGKRRMAMELLAAGVTIHQIEERTQVNRRQLYRFIERCIDTHADGRPFGFRALVRYTNVIGYDRLRPFEATSGSGFGAAAGAFSLLLQAHPCLTQWIKDHVKHKRVALVQVRTDGTLRTRLRNLKHAHLSFLSEYRKIGITASDYPFNTERMAIRALYSALRAECLESFGRAAKVAGASHLKGLPQSLDDVCAPAATQFLDVV